MYQGKYLRYYLDDNSLTFGIVRQRERSGRILFGFWMAVRGLDIVDLTWRTGLRIWFGDRKVYDKTVIEGYR